MPTASKIIQITRTSKFERDFKALDPVLLAAAKQAIIDLLKYPIPDSLRLHSLKGYKNPKIYTIDVLGNKSYKISLEITGGVANLRRIASHKALDRLP